MRKPQNAVCERCKNGFRGKCSCPDGCTLLLGDCLDVMKRLPPESVDLVFGSPPYCDARTYGIDAQRGCIEWVEWMLGVSEAAQRVCRGPVLWVAAGVTRGRCYWPAVEGLMWEWYKRGGEHQLYRPCAWVKNGIPGSGGDDWFRADWEYVVCLKRTGRLPWSDNTAMGHPPRWAPGGEMSYRLRSGARVNQWGGHGNGIRGRDGKPQDGNRPSHAWFRVSNDLLNGSHARQICVKANPGNVIYAPVGGGLIGDHIAHENEAPFPEKLAEFFIRSLCPPGGTVLDPFVGSGTTLKVAREWGRRAIGIDVRQSQIELCRKRLEQWTLPLEIADDPRP